MSFTTHALSLPSTEADKLIVRVSKMRYLPQHGCQIKIEPSSNAGWANLSIVGETQDQAMLGRGFLCGIFEMLPIGC